MGNPQSKHLEIELTVERFRRETNLNLEQLKEQAANWYEDYLVLAKEYKTLERQNKTLAKDNQRLTGIAIDLMSAPNPTAKSVRQIRHLETHLNREPNSAPDLALHYYKLSLERERELSIVEEIARGLVQQQSIESLDLQDK